MYFITKIIGLLLFCFGIMLLATSFDSIYRTLDDTIALGFSGLVFIAVGVLCLIWHEPYYDTKDN